MIPPFSLALPPRSRFGRGEALAAMPEVAAMGRRLALVHGASPDRAIAFVTALTAAGTDVTTVPCPHEPDLPMLEAALIDLKGRVDVVIAVGGGAALDFGKALAALLPDGAGAPLDHLEVVGQGAPLFVPPLPFVAIPTTAGTGAEATKNAVITVPEHRRKVSLRDDRMVARLAIVDPCLTDGTPRSVTLASGLDAVTQVIEPYLSHRANPITDALCRDAIPRGLTALARLMRDGETPSARDALCLTSHASGIALANAGLGAVHGLAGVLGGATGAPHGEICGQLLAPVLSAYAIRLDRDGEAFRRLSDIESWCAKSLGVGFGELQAWSRDMGLPRPSPQPVSALRTIASEAQRSSSMKPSPIQLSQDTLYDVLTSAGWLE